MLIQRSRIDELIHNFIYLHVKKTMPFFCLPPQFDLCHEYGENYSVLSFEKAAKLYQEISMNMSLIALLYLC